MYTSILNDLGEHQMEVVRQALEDFLPYCYDEDGDPYSFRTLDRTVLVPLVERIDEMLVRWRASK